MLSFLPRGVLDEILNLIESVSEGFPSYSYLSAGRHIISHACKRTGYPENSRSPARQNMLSIWGSVPYILQRGEVDIMAHNFIQTLRV